MIHKLLKNTLVTDSLITKLPNKRIYIGGASKDVKPPYIVYNIIMDAPGVYAENEPITFDYIIQVDVFSFGDYTELEKVVVNQLDVNGFRYNNGATLFEEDTQLHHRALRYNITLDKKGRII